jgi:hypothetical protein
MESTVIYGINILSNIPLQTQGGRFWNLEFDIFIIIFFLRVKYPIGTWVLRDFKFSTSVLFYIIDGTWIKSKNSFGTSVRFSVWILTSRHVSTAEVDMWHYIKKKLKIKNWNL